MEKKNKKSIIIGLVLLLIIILAIVGIAYAYYRTRVIGNKLDESISGVTNKLEVTYIDGAAELSMNGLIEPGFSATKTFYVENSANQAASYSIIIDNMINNFNRNQDWQYTLTENGTQIAKGNLAVGTHQVLAGSRSVEAKKGAKNTYVLTLTYINSSEDQSEDMGKTLSLRINISDEEYTWDNAPSGSLLYAIKNNQPSGSETTIPGQAANSANEARILTTEDDFGTSYVYRGNVTNNYVTYSNMCWRIVRVQGDGTIKLALADYQHPCGTANGYSVDNESSSFLTTSSYGAHYNRVGHLKFAYLTYEGSSIYNNNIVYLRDALAIDETKLVQTDWCEDTSVSKNKSFGMLLNSNGITYNKQYYLDGLTDDWYLQFMFGASSRMNLSTANPSLKCNFKGVEIEEFSDNIKRQTEAHRYNGYYGLLSADELAFAGSIETSNNNITINHYLTTNAKNTYWLITPYNFNYYEYQYYTMTKTGKFSYTPDAHPNNSPASHYIRPSIVLKSSVLLDTNTVYTQDGTIDKPYVIG